MSLRFNIRTSGVQFRRFITGGVYGTNSCLWISPITLSSLTILTFQIVFIKRNVCSLNSSTYPHGRLRGILLHWFTQRHTTVGRISPDAWSPPLPPPPSSSSSSSSAALQPGVDSGLLYKLIPLLFNSSQLLPILHLQHFHIFEDAIDPSILGSSCWSFPRWFRVG